MVKVQLLGDMTSWSDVKAGKLFHVMLGGEACIGMKVEGTTQTRGGV
jgi:hypothetical protein